MLSVVGLERRLRWTYVAVVRGRMRTADEIAFYLDAAAVFFGSWPPSWCSVGAGSSTTDRALRSSRIGAFFMGILAVTLLLHLATHVPIATTEPGRSSSASAFAAAGYIGLLTRRMGRSR